MSTSDDSSSDLASSKLAVEEERDWDEWDKDQRKSSGKSQKRTWPPSDSEIAVDEDKGWEDWDEDQRRALGKSHQRTLGSLEEGSPRSPSISSVRSGLSVPTTEDPKGQLLPSDQTISRQEQEAKKRRHLKDDPLKPATKFFTKPCVALSVVGLLCLVAAIAITFIVPYGSLKEFLLPMLSDGNTNPVQDNGHSPTETILPVQLPDRYVEQIQAPTSGTAVMIEKPSDSLVQIQVSETSNAQIPSANTIVQIEATPQIDKKVNAVDKGEEELGVISSFWKRVATFIGMESNLMKNSETTGSDMIVPDYIAHALADTIVPNYENLYSLTLDPVVDTQPVFWLTQRSASGTLKDILTFCFGLVLSCDAALSHKEASVG